MDNVDSHAHEGERRKETPGLCGVPGGKSVLSAPPLLFLVYMISRI